MLISVITITSITGCVSEAMQSWVGHHYSEVIGKWGPPTRVLDDVSGGKIMIWESTRSHTTPGYATTEPYGFLSRPSYETTYTPPRTTAYTTSRTFWVNSEGIIYNWAWKGL